MDKYPLEFWGLIIVNVLMFTGTFSGHIINLINARRNLKANQPVVNNTVLRGIIDELKERVEELKAEREELKSENKEISKLYSACVAERRALRIEKEERK